MYRKAWAILQLQRDSNELPLARLAHRIGVIYETTGRKAEAKPYFATAQTIWEKSLRNGTARLEAMVILANLYARAGQAPSEKQLLQQALVLAEQELGPSHPQTAEVLLLYAKSLRQAKQKKEAASLEKRAKTIRAGSQESLAQYTISFHELTREKASK
jgi:hypothetical protein